MINRPLTPRCALIIFVIKLRVFVSNYLIIFGQLRNKKRQKLGVRASDGPSAARLHNTKLSLEFS